MKNAPIGIIDSGVGGLSVWQEIVKQLPSESTQYIADQQYVPYGTKSQQEIYLLSKRLISSLVEQKVKAIVVACNTISVTCLEHLRIDFPDIPIIGTVPVVKAAVERTKTNAIGVLSTIQTAKSEYQKHLLDEFADGITVINIGTDKLVPLVEKGELEGEKVQMTLKKVLKPFTEKRVDVIALGCTHFPFLKGTIQQILGESVVLLDSSGAVARQLKHILTQNDTLSEGKEAKYTFMTTGTKEQFTKVITSLLGSLPGTIEQKDL